MGNEMWTDQHHTVHQEHTNPDLIKSHKLVFERRSMYEIIDQFQF